MPGECKKHHDKSVNLLQLFCYLQSARVTILLMSCSIKVQWQDFLTCQHLLRDDTCGSEHGETAIVQLLGLQLLQALRIFGFETKRVPAIVTRRCVGIVFPVPM